MKIECKRIRNLIISLFAIITLILSLNQVKAAEGDVIKSGTTGDCTYTLVELADGNYSLTISGNGAMEDYTSYTKVSWYSYVKSIEEVIVEDGVTSIGSCAFSFCKSLAEIDLSNCTSLTSIGNSAFSYCELLTEVDLSNCTSLISIGNSAFSYCELLTEVDLSNCTSLTSIGNYAFRGCTSLESIEIPGSVTSIGSLAFDDCASLTAINVDESNTTYASMDGVLFNKDITTLIRYPEGKDEITYTVPSTVTSIESYAFDRCTVLTEVDLSNCATLTNIGNYAFLNCTSLTEIDLSNCTSLTSIGDGAFYSCTSLESVELSDNITSIGSSAFNKCTSLTEVDLSNCTSLTSIGNSAFDDCTSLASIGLPCSIISIEGFAFRDCTSLIEVDLSNCTLLTSIESGAFSGCTSLANIDLTNCISLKTIEDRVFSDCTSLLEIDLSDCTLLTSIEDSTFRNCTALEKVNIPSSVTSIGILAFAGCTSITYMDLSGVETIGSHAFENCISLTVDLSDCINLKSISSYAFNGCLSLENINISALTNLTSIGYAAFYGCCNLQSLKLPSSIETIDDYAFDYTSLTNIDLSECSSLTYIGKYAFFSMFDDIVEISMSLPKDIYLEFGEGALAAVDIDENTWVYSNSGNFYINSDGVAYRITDDGAYLAYIPSGIEIYIVPSTVIVNDTSYGVIGADDFSLFYSANLTELNFEDPSKITTIESYTFAYCKTLEKINGYTTTQEIQSSFSSATLEDTAVEATKINTIYDMCVEIDLSDNSSGMEEWIKSLIDVADLEEIAIQLYCNGEIVEEKTITITDDTTYYCTFENLSIENEYYIDVAHDNANWGAYITYEYAGYNLPKYAYVNIGTKYAYTATLEIDQENSAGQLSSVDVALVDEAGNIVDTATLSEDNNWTYVFYVNYSNNLESAKVYNLQNYTLVVLEDENYEYNEEIEYADTISNSNMSSFGTCTYYTFTSYSYSPGATISLAYSQYSDIIVHHYIEDTQTPVPSSDGGTVEDETYTGIVGDLYETEPSDLIAQNYEYVSDSGNTTGEYQETTTEIIYYYTLKDSNVTSTIEKSGTPETITSEGESITYTIEYNATVEDYIGSGIVTITDNLPYEIEDTYTSTVLLNDEEVTVVPEYDGGEKTLVWEIPVDSIDITNNEVSIEITLAVVYVDVNYGLESITNEVEASIYLEETDQTIQTDLTEEITYIDIDIEIAVTKIWDDNEDENQKRPESITLNLVTDDQTIDSYVMTESDGWEYIFEKVAKYDSSGQEIEYVIIEEEANTNDLYFYTTTGGEVTKSNGVYSATITNTFTVPSDTTSLTVTKVWDDESNTYNKRPTSIIIDVLNGDEVVKQEEITGTTYTWEYEIDGLVMYDENGNVITYAIDEEEKTTGDLEKYTKEVDGYTITNTLITHNVTTRVDGEGGSITGEDEDPYEVVPHNDSNTKVIEIVPDTGYKIDTITINGEELEFTPDEDGSYTLPTIENITEDKEVVVTFEPKETSILIKHQTEDGEDLVDPEEQTGVYGQEYETEPKEFDEYELKTTPDNASGTMEEEQIVIIYVYSKIYGKITITKVDKSDETKVLSGATYKIEKLDDNGDVDDTFEAVEATTGEDGIATFESLTVGTYRITEIQAPDGYELATSYTDVEITKDNRDIEIVLTDTEIIVTTTLDTGDINYPIVILTIGIEIIVICYILKNKKKPENF